MAEPTDAERARVWALIEEIEGHAAVPEPEWRTVLDLAETLVERVRSFHDRPEGEPTA